MNLSDSLSGAHLRTYQMIFQHPISHNLDWRAVRNLFANLGEVAEEPNGNLKVTVHGHSLLIHPPRTKDVSEMDEVLALRHFLRQADGDASGSVPHEVHGLVVIDHHQARVYRTILHGTVPQQVMPHEPEDYFRHAHNSKDFTRGQEKPDPNSFFELVTRGLPASGPILIFGTGTGMSNEMDQFAAWLHEHHADMFRRVIGTEVVDEYHLSPGQLLATARKFYAKNAIPVA